MGIPIQTITKPLNLDKSLSPQKSSDVFSDHMGGLVVSELFGKYYNLTRAGIVYGGTTAAAAIPAVGSAFTHCWWNPSSSGILMVPIRLTLAYANASGAQVAGVNDSFRFTGFAAGDFVGTAPNSQLITFSGGNGLNQFVNYQTATGTGFIDGSGSRPSKVKIGSTANAQGSGIIFSFRGLSISQQAVATTGTSMFNWFEDFDGTLIISPGVLFGIQGEVASGDKFVAQMIWAELPL